MKSLLKHYGPIWIYDSPMTQLLAAIPEYRESGGRKLMMEVNEIFLSIGGKTDAFICKEEILEESGSG